MLDPYEVMKNSFRDELEKIAGEMQGFTRSGIKPIGVERLLERESESEKTPSSVFQKDVEKLSAAGKALALLGTGGVLALAGQRANRDRQMGRQMRLQGQGQGY